MASTDPNSRAGKLRDFIKTNPHLNDQQVAAATNESPRLAAYARESLIKSMYRKRKPRSKKPVAVQLPAIDSSNWTVSTHEEDEAFDALANTKQVGGNHYKDQAIQPWDYIAANQLGYLEGNIVKYVSLWQIKGGLEDLKKAKHYLDKLIEVNK